MKAAVFDQCGDPASVLQVRDLPMPEPGVGQVRVRMIASPINPSDLLTVRGTYGRAPKLPATPGYEGVGVIDATGPGLLKLIRGLKPGRRVAVLNSGGGNWADYVVLSARNVVPLPDAIPDEQAASFFVNPATALVMTRQVLRVPRGAWLVQTAAGSALGRMIIRLARHEGYRTINLVRRREQVGELKQLGADEVICTSDEDVAERVQAITNGQGVPFALDCVGGATGLAAALALASGGKMLVYGTLSEEPISVPPRLLIAGQKSIAGFWLSEWAKEQGVWSMLKLFREIKKMMIAGILTTPVGSTFSLDQIAEAVRQAEQPGRQGKVLLRIAKS